jgi:alanine dehydrogenase
MSEPLESTLHKIKKEFNLTPKEALAELMPIRKSLFIGIPKETAFQEKRIALTPNSVATMVNQGHRVLIECGAGENANFDDEEYLNAGADMAYSKDEVFKAGILLKCAPLLPEEISLLHAGQVLFSPVLLPGMLKSTIKGMMEKKVTALSYEYIKSDYNHYPFTRSMGEIAGSFAILLAGKYLSHESGKGILLGGISGQPPCKVLILGAGAVGEAAARAAIGMGAQVQVFDDNIFRLTRLQNHLGQKVYTSVIDPLNLKKNLSRADVLIGALSAIGGRTPCVVSESMVQGMKKGSVIIDVSIDHGGCVETSRVTDHDHPIFIKHGVIHYGVPNIASNVARTASYAMSNILAPMLRQISQTGGVEHMVRNHAGLRHGTYLYKGALTKEFIAQKFDLKFTDLELILSADF